jgi:hypothetical protein
MSSSWTTVVVTLSVRDLVHRCRSAHRERRARRLAHDGRGEDPPSKARIECTADAEIRRKVRAPAARGTAALASASLASGGDGREKPGVRADYAGAESPALALATPGARRLSRCEPTRYTADMKLHRALLVFALLTIAPFAVSCRAAQFNRLDERVDKLESRTAVLEAQVAMLMKK